MPKKAPKPYVPSGRVVVFLEMVERDLMREFTSHEAAGIMGCDPRAVGAFLEHSMRAGLVFFRSTGRKRFWRGQPYREGHVRGQSESANERRVRSGMLNAVQPRDGWVTSADDIRVPKVVAGWKPPAMVPPRGCA